MISNYEESKQKSNYHFNNKIIDKDTVIYVGKFVNTWENELETIIKNSKPASWETRGYKAKENNIPQPELDKEEYDLIRVGLDPKMTITHLNWELPTVLQKMSDLFCLKDCMNRIHVQKPGEVWNLHIDKLYKWCPENPDSVVRFMIQLTDWQPGQFWEYGNYHHNQWEAGEVTTFDWRNIPHCTANAGYHPRVTFQITGVATEKTKQFLLSLREGPIKINT